MADEVQGFLDMVESQHASKPKFMGVLRKYLEAVDVATQIAVKIPDRFSLTSPDIDLSDVGDGQYVDAWLDRIGEMVGVSRAYPYNETYSGLPAVMNNATYLLVLSAKIMQNNWDGAYGTFQTAWQNSVGKYGVRATCKDNQDMSCTVVVHSNLTTEQAALIKSTRLFPKPMGVRFEFNEAGRLSELATTRVGAAISPYSYKRVTVYAEER